MSFPLRIHLLSLILSFVGSTPKRKLLQILKRLTRLRGLLLLFKCGVNGYYAFISEIEVDGFLGLLLIWS